MCLKVRLVALQPTFTPRGSSDNGIEEKSESLVVDVSEGDRGLLAV